MDDDGRKYMSEFTKEEQDLGDKAYIQCMEHIQKVVNEYLDKEEIIQCVYEAMRDGVHRFLEDYYAEIIKEIGDEICDDIRDNITFTLNISKKEPRRVIF